MSYQSSFFRFDDHKIISWWLRIMEPLIMPYTPTPCHSPLLRLGPGSLLSSLLSGVLRQKPVDQAIASDFATSVPEYDLLSSCTWRHWCLVYIYWCFGRTCRFHLQGRRMVGRQHVLPITSYLSARLHGVTSRKTVILIFTSASISSNLM
jgi:hypothetical protein